MNSIDFDQMYKSALKSSLSEEDATNFALRIEKDTKPPKGMRTPRVKEIMDMQTYIANYKKQSPKASKREIRNAVKREFNLTILK